MLEACSQAKRQRSLSMLQKAELCTGVRLLWLAPRYQWVGMDSVEHMKGPCWWGWCANEVGMAFLANTVLS